MACLPAPSSLSIPASVRSNHVRDDPSLAVCYVDQALSMTRR